MIEGTSSRNSVGGGPNVALAMDSAYSTLTAVLTVVPIAAIIVIIVFGNALVIFAVLRDDRLKNKMQNWLILSLSVADLLVGMVIMPLTLSYEILGRWTLGSALCEIWLALDVLFVTASILNLCVISIDRYWSLTDPMYTASKRTRMRTLTMIACIWILAFAICLPPLAGWRPEVRTAGKCNLSDDVGYVLYSSVGSFYLPLVILIFIYVKIFQITRRRARVQRRKVRQRENLLLLAGPTQTEEPDAATPLCAKNGKVGIKRTALVTRKASNHRVAISSVQPNVNCSVPVLPSPTVVSMSAKVSVVSKVTVTTAVADDTRPGTAATTPPRADRASAGNDMLPGLLLKPLELQLRMMQHRKQVRRRERQATLLLGLILGAFTICWLPFFCIYVLGAVCCKTPELVFDVIFWMGYCNSGLNPFIYNFFNPDFRLAFRKILCGSRRR